MNRGLDLPDEPEPGGAANSRGVLAWFASNPVASNLLMAVLIAGGLFTLPSIKREVFPEFELDLVTVSVAYPGASPEEVEQGVVLAVEEAVRDVEGVKEITGSASEGAGVVTIELLLNADRDRALADVKSAVDRISSFPVDAERPLVSLVVPKRGVLSLIVYGDVDAKSLRALAERTRDGLLQEPDISSVELSGERALEISVEVPQANLRRYGLTLEQVAEAVRGAAVELPAGGVKTDKGEVLIRLSERRDLGLEFENIVVLSRPDGARVLLGDIAEIRDGFAETDQEAFFDGKPAARVDVYRVGEEDPITVSEAVRRYVAEHEGALPPTVQLAVWNDSSEMFADRIELLRSNAVFGLLLVIGVLGLFLDFRLAFWVTMGIPASFIGSLLLLPWLNVSINMISLFAFIVTLGMVVDDAIIVGEAVHKHRRDGRSLHDAAIAGVREVAVPVAFAIATTILAFSPLLFVPGTTGKFFRNIPIVVIAVLAISLVESLFTLPSHLSEKKHALTTIVSAPLTALDRLCTLLLRTSPIGWLVRQQQRFAHGVEWFVDTIFAKWLRGALLWRYSTMAVGVAVLILTWGWVAGGRVQFTFMPKIDGDVVSSTLTMPVGTPVDVTRGYQRRMMDVAQQILGEATTGPTPISRGMYAEIGGAGMGRTGSAAGGASAGHRADVMLFLVPSDKRQISTSEFARRWRDRLGQVPGAESLTFDFSTGHAGIAIDVRLSHPEPAQLEAAAAQLALSLKDYSGVYDVDDGTARGKEQLDLRLRPEARSLGVTQRDLARQVRSAFFGAEALRQQRGRNELRVYVRRPLAERHSEHDIEHLVVRAPGGGELPLMQAAGIERGRAYTTIRRTQGRRTLDVTADVDTTRGNAEQILGSLQREVLPGLLAATPGLTYTLEGRGRDRAEIMAGLGEGFRMALLCMFALLAVAFRSYVHPLIVLFAIPFGIVGAVLGHILLGYDLSIMSVFGLVALSGVVVNDSLVMVDAINRYKAEGMSMLDAVIAGGTRRFRPIILTSVTTFFGLMPMILESSMQARFLIPMAISLGCGVMFATAITLLLVPCAYLMVDDAAALIARGTRLFGVRDTAASDAE